MPIDTKSAERREVRYASFDEVAAELDRIEAAVRAGTVWRTGNWTVGQICEHCAIFLAGALDGFRTRAPAPMRFVARLMLKKNAVSTDKPFPAGFKLPKAASELIPDDETEDLEGVTNLKRQVERVRAGAKMTHPSPLLGKLTHDEWVTLQLKHFDLHLSFITGIGEGGGRVVRPGDRRAESSV